jgi:hypothetical protein
MLLSKDREHNKGDSLKDHFIEITGMLKHFDKYRSQSVALV